MFKGFHDRFPEIGIAESRAITQKEPEDTLLLLELYCDEVGCDCRRVLVQAHSARELHAGRPGLVASFGFGWETEAFYRSWSSSPLTDADLAELRGPALHPSSPRSPAADHALVLFRIALDDPRYVERIERHYRMFRDSLAPRPIAPPPGPNRKARRAARKQRPIYG